MPQVAIWALGARDDPGLRLSHVRNGDLFEALGRNGSKWPPLNPFESLGRVEPIRTLVADPNRYVLWNHEAALVLERLTLNPFWTHRTWAVLQR